MSSCQQPLVPIAVSVIGQFESQHADQASVGMSLRHCRSTRCRSTLTAVSATQGPDGGRRGGGASCGSCCRRCSYLHDVDVWHRDLKSSNLLLSRAGRAPHHQGQHALLHSSFEFRAIACRSWDQPLATGCKAGCILDALPGPIFGTSPSSGVAQPDKLRQLLWSSKRYPLSPAGHDLPRHHALQLQPRKRPGALTAASLLHLPGGLFSGSAQVHATVIGGLPLVGRA